MKTRKFIDRFFLFSFLFVLSLFLLACLVPFLPAGRYWIVAMLGLIFPFLLLLVLAFLVMYIVKRSKWAVVTLVALLLSWNQLSAFFAFRLRKEFNNEKSAETIRVLSWNVSRWDERNRQKRPIPHRELMFDFIKEYSPDVLCLQEFFECNDPAYFQSNRPALKEMGYEYQWFFPSSQLFGGKFQYGLMIASRFPILDSAGFLNGADAHSEGISYADIKWHDQTIRIFNSHLESVGFTKKEYDGLTELSSSARIGGKFKRAYGLRTAQVNNAVTILRQSPNPVIHASDLDDVPNSYAYFQIRGNLQDAFLRKGSGIGRTFRFLSPTLRIDYIFADRKFRVKQFSIPKIPYSDHYPIIADFEKK